MSRGRAAWLPSPREQLLLRASLWDEARALDAWTEWRRATPDLERVERGSYRLLPLLYGNLGRRLDDDVDADRLRGIYRRSWAVNQLALRIGRTAIEALQGAGLEVMVLKGAALIGSAYRDPGARPIGDVDLAVRPDRVGEAVRALGEAGFLASEKDPERKLAVRHSLAFRHPDGQEVDLHRSVLWLPELDDEFWRGSVEAEVAGARVRILGPADQLVHVCAHGAAWNPVSPIRWAADAFKAIESAGRKLDWGRLASLAERGRLTLPLGHALAHLAKELGAPVPASTPRELARVPVGAVERRAYAALAQPPSSRRSFSMLWWFWERHRAQAALEGRRPGPAGFVRHMRDFWGLERISRVPVFALRRLLRHRPRGGRREPA